MTSPAAPGFARLNPRIPLLAFTALWLAQSGCWLLQESREELGSETGTVAPLAGAGLLDSPIGAACASSLPPEASPSSSPSSCSLLAVTGL